MRKPIVALGLCLSTGLGAISVADTLAAAPPGSTLSLTPPSSSLPAPSSTTRLASGVSGASIVQTAMKYLGYPYTATGNSPATGFSCIGFVSYVYRQNGIPLPGDLQDAYAYGTQVSFADLEPGDIMFFQNTVWPGISHAAIYIGGGRFIHAEWYGKGVRITSFRNDPVDGSWWVPKYLGATRPWTGAVSSAADTSGVVTAPTAVAGSGAVSTAVPTVAPQPRPVSGPTVLITVPSVNVRSGPSMKHTVQTVASQGTSVVILGKSNGWYKVQLPNGAVGWIVGAGIGRSPTPNAHAATTAKGVAPTVGNPTAPTRQGTPVRSTRLAAQVQADGLRVHSSPSLDANVLTTLPAGQRVQVLARRHGWVKVLLPDGTTGWVSAGYIASQGARTGARAVSATAATSTSKIPSPKATQTSTAQVTINVHAGPSLDATITTSIAAGAGYTITGWSHGWAHVALPGGQTGWVSGTVLSATPAGAPATTYAVHQSRHAARARAASPGNHVLTAGVRVHSSPGINSPVIGLAAAGTHVHVLAYRGRWVRIRLPDGTTGFVDGTYVQ